MLTSTGIRVTQDNGNVPSPRDIAVGMGRVCRFGGAVWSPLLSHSVMVAELVRRHLTAENVLEADLATWAWALLHDAHEVVMGEIPRPWKNAARKIEESAFDARLAESFGINLEDVHRDIIKAADELALRCEAVVLELPDFERVYTEQSGLDRFPMPSPDELKLMRLIARSDLHRSIMSTYDRSGAVVDFGRVLEIVKGRNLDDAILAFNELLLWNGVKE